MKLFSGIFAVSAALLVFLAALQPCSATDKSAHGKYTYSLPPTSGPDAGKLTLPLAGPLTDRKDEIIVWNNGKNELAGKTISITFDFETVQYIRKLKARTIFPTWDNFHKLTFFLSLDGVNWIETCSQAGFPDIERDGGKIRTWEYIQDIPVTQAQYVRVDIQPQGWVSPTISDIVITLADTPAVAITRETALAGMHGFFRADILPPKTWEGYAWEGWRKGDTAVPPGAGPGGFIQAYLNNISDSPQQISNIILSMANGSSLDLQKSFKNFSNMPDMKGVDKNNPYYSSTRFGLPEIGSEVDNLVSFGDPVWYNVEPNPIPPHSRGEITIRCRVAPASPVTVSTTDSPTPQPVALNDDTSGLRITSISFSYDLSKVYLYVKRSADSVQPVDVILIDGKDVTENMFEMQSSWNSGGVAGYIVRLAEPLKVGTFHQFTAITGDGKYDTTQIKARDAFFPICMFGPPVDEEAFLKDLGRNGFNSVAWYNLTAEKAIQYGLRIFSGESGNPAVYGSFIHDEPDCGDYSCPEISSWYKLGAYGNYVASKRKTMGTDNPQAIQILNMDSTFKPINWMCYAQLGDLITHDPYYAGNVESGKDPMMVYADMKILTDNCAPKPSNAILYACADPVYGFKRFMTNEELELQNAYALSAGVKAIGYWWYRDSVTVANNPAMMRAMGRANIRIRQISEYLANGIAVDWVKAFMKGTPKQHPIASGPVKVWCGSVWSNDAIAVFVCNNEYISNEKGFSSKAIKHVNVDVALPEDWKDNITISEISDSGTQEPGTLQVKSGKARFTVDSVEVSRWYLIKHYKK